MDVFARHKMLFVVPVIAAAVCIVLTATGLIVPPVTKAADLNQGDVARLLQKTWYMAEGYTGGSFQTWVAVQNPGAQKANVSMEFQVPAGRPAPAPYAFELPAKTRKSVRLDDIPGLENTEVSTRVSADVNIYAQRSMYFDENGRQGGSSTMAAAIPDFEWYLAEGYTGGTFETFVCIQNPGPDTCKVTMSFNLLAGGAADPYAFDLPGRTRRTVKLDDLPGLMGTDVSTRVSATQPVVVERAMYYDYFGKDGGDCSLGQTSTDTEWYIPEGYTGDSFDTYVLVQNPGTEEAAVRLNFQLSGGEDGETRAFKMAPGTRRTVKLDELPGLDSAEVATVISSDKPVVAERAMYFDRAGSDDGHSSPASDSISDVWQVPEGCTSDGFETYLSVQNPGDSQVEVTLEFQPAPGYEIEPYKFEVQADGRESVSLNRIDGFPETDVSTTVRATAPVIVESSMYYDRVGMNGGHSCLGVIPNTLMPNGVMLDQASEALVTSAPDGQVVFSSSNDLIDSIEVDDVVCGMPCEGAPSGFMRKVKEVQHAGSVVTLITEQAALQEFVRYGFFYGTHDPAGGARQGGFDVTVPFNVDLSSYGNIKGEVSVGVSVDISIHIKWKGWWIFKVPVGFTFRMAAGFQQSANFTLTAGDNFTLDKEVKIKTFYLSPIDAGPLVFFPRVSIYVGFTGNLARGTVLSCGESLSAQAGFGYDDGWYTISNFDPGASADASLPYASMDAKPYIREALECLLYDIVGPYIDVMQYIRLHSDPAADPWWVVYAGVQADGGIDIDLLIWTLKWHGKIYGYEWQIKSAPPKPKITGINPNPSATGTQVTLSGSSFGGAKSPSWYVTFGGTRASEYGPWSDGSITCTVPGGLSGRVTVQVFNDGGLSAGADFGVQPHIGGVSPPSGKTGSNVTVTGTSFGASRGSSYVCFNGVGSPGYSSWSDSSVTCEVPAGISGVANVTVTTSGGESNWFQFNVIPDLDAVTPASGTIGSEVKLTGNAFGATRGGSYVTFGGVQATQYTGWADGEIRCLVPAGVSGTVDVTVTTPGGTSNAVKFGVAPHIDGLSPGSGTVNTTVTIVGSGFGPAQGDSYVKFDGVKAVAYASWSDGQVVCNVPFGAWGITNVTLVTGGGTSNGQRFVVVPHLDIMDPQSGIVGSTVTLTGSAFGPTRGSSYVMFGDTKVTTYTSWNDVKIVCKVPLGAAGPVQVGVTTEGGASNTMGFSVVPDVDDVDPNAGVVGSQVTLTGTGFGGSRGDSSVTFGSVPVTDYDSWTDTKVVCHVPVGASGNVPVVLTTAGGSSAPLYFNVIPRVDGVDPGSGVVGTAVTMAGAGFGDTQGDSFVAFGGVKVVDYQSWADNQVVCLVPLGAHGDTSLTVTTGGGTSAGADFKVIPKIDGIDPAASQAGTQVTISGSAFGDDQGTSFVTFGPFTVTDYVSWSDTQVVIEVPNDAFGQVQVSLTTDGGESNQVGFNVLPYINDVLPPSGGMSTTVSVEGSGFGTSRGDSMVLFGTTEAARYTSWSDRVIKCVVPVGPTAGTVRVVTSGGTSNGEDFTVFTPTWYLSEGTCAWGFSTYITIMNPNPEALTASVTYMIPEGAGKAGGGVPPMKVDLPPNSQTTINPMDYLKFETDFSTRVDCLEGKMIAVDRTMQWTGAGAPSFEKQCSVGTVAPATHWMLPEGSALWGFETWLTLQNPGDAQANCEVTYMIEGGEPRKVTHKLAPRSRTTYGLVEEVGRVDASVEVDSDLPVIAEGVIYRNSRREGSSSVGTTLPAHGYYVAVKGRGLSHDQFLAEGTTREGFTTFLELQNPNAEAGWVRVQYMTEDGVVTQPEFTMPPMSRKTIRVNDVLPGRDFGIHVHGQHPVAAQRTMYWGAGTPAGEATHGTIAMTDLHNAFYFPDGQTSNGCETYTVLQNPNKGAVWVEVSYLSAEGDVLSRFKVEVPPGSRRTLNMADKVKDRRASVLARVVWSEQRIMAERVMYWNNRGAGACSIGGFEDSLP